MSLSPKHSYAFLLAFLLFVCFQSVSAQDKNWRDVSPAELQQKTPKVEADADAEALFWEVRVDDSSLEQLTMKHYIRVKIYTERGREKYSKIDIPYPKGIKIRDLMARVIKADGTIVEVAKTDIFDREIAKLNKVNVKARSFAVPNIEPGVIVEYQYKEVIAGASASNMRMLFQRDIPIQTISYYFKPVGGVGTKYFTFNMDDNKFIKDKNGFYRATMENVPALKEEPRMPPEDEVRSWLLLYYTDDTQGDFTDFWARAGGFLARSWEIKDTLKPGKEIKAAAQQIAGDAGSPDEQLARIFEFCKTKIKNITFDTSISDEEKEKIKPNKSTLDTYKKMQGSSRDINELFASLATGLGLEARLAFGGNRSEKFFNPRQAHTSFIHFTGIAVNVNNQWKYYDPGSPFVSYGMLSWFEEGTSVLLLGYKDYIRTEIPMSKADKTLARRTGKFKLLDDGTLEGTVKIEYTGHLSTLYKLNNYESSPAKREESLKEEVKKQISAAEISDISVENVTDPEKPFVYQYKIRVPNYAQKTGKRLFFQPGFFEYGTNPLFSSSTRKYDIYFQYPWSESDDVEIELPSGFQLEAGEKPGEMADASRIGVLSINFGVSSDSKVLKYKRSFRFGGGDNVLFPVGAYPQLKKMFDAFHVANTHLLTLKQD